MQLFFMPIDGLFFSYRSLQKVLIARFKKGTGPCCLSENDREYVLKHAYPFLINLWHFSRVGFQPIKTCDIHQEGFGLAKNLRVKKCSKLTGREYAHACLFPIMLISDHIPISDHFRTRAFF